MTVLKSKFTESKEEIFELLNGVLNKIPKNIEEAIHSTNPYSITVDYNPVLENGVVSYGYKIITKCESGIKHEVCKLKKGDVKNV